MKKKLLSPLLAVVFVVSMVSLPAYAGDYFLTADRIYIGPTESEMITEFIGKIVVHEADKTSGERTQKVDIYLNFIGKFDLPDKEMTPEEIVAEETARRKRERCREAQRRYVARKHEQEALAVVKTEKKKIVNTAQSSEMAQVSAM